MHILLNVFFSESGISRQKLGKCMSELKGGYFEKSLGF